MGQRRGPASARSGRHRVALGSHRESIRSTAARNRTGHRRTPHHETAELRKRTQKGAAGTTYNRPAIFLSLEPVQKVIEALQGFLNISRMDASLRKARPLQFRVCQSLANRRQRFIMRWCVPQSIVWVEVQNLWPSGRRPGSVMVPSGNASAAATDSRSGRSMPTSAGTGICTKPRTRSRPLLRSSLA
jgi:hypothetical protein